MVTTYSAIERNKKPAGALEIPENYNFYYLNKKDRQMRFNNCSDPIYAVFNKIDERPLSKIAKDLKIDRIKLYRYANGDCKLDNMPALLLIQLSSYLDIEINDLNKQMREYLKDKQ